MSFISKKKYFTNRLPNGFGSFYLAKTIHFTASGLLGIFTPIVAGVIIIHFGFSILFFNCNYFIIAIRYTFSNNSPCA